MSLVQRNARKSVRFAPCPSGPLHIGHLRIVLANIAYSNLHSLDCILRVDNTNFAFRKYDFFADLVVLGLFDFFHQVVFQSHRFHIYKKILGDIQNRLEKINGVYFIRVPKFGQFFDHVVKKNIMLKNEQELIPIYNEVSDRFFYIATSAFDDFLLNTCHIIRGADHISNAPKQLFIIKELCDAYNVQSEANIACSHLQLCMISVDGISVKISKSNPATQFWGIQNLISVGFIPEAIIFYAIRNDWQKNIDLVSFHSFINWIARNSNFHNLGCLRVFVKEELYVINAKVLRKMAVVIPSRLQVYIKNLHNRHICCTFVCLFASEAILLKDFVSLYDTWLSVFNIFVKVDASDIYIIAALLEASENRLSKAAWKTKHGEKSAAYFQYLQSKLFYMFKTIPHILDLLYSFGFAMSRLMQLMFYTISPNSKHFPQDIVHQA